MHDSAAVYSTVLLLSVTSNSRVNDDMSLMDAIPLFVHAGLLKSMTSETKFELLCLRTPNGTCKRLAMKKSTLRIHIHLIPYREPSVSIRKTIHVVY